MGTGYSWDPPNSYPEQPAQESGPSGRWTDQDWSWRGDWCFVGCWWVWLFYCSTHCLRMYNDEEMSFEHMSSWNRHTGNRRTCVYTQNTQFLFHLLGVYTYFLSGLKRLAHKSVFQSMFYRIVDKWNVLPQSVCHSYFYLGIILVFCFVLFGFFLLLSGLLSMKINVSFALSLTGPCVKKEVCGKTRACHQLLFHVSWRGKITKKV